MGLLSALAWLYFAALPQGFVHRDANKRNQEDRMCAPPPVHLHVSLSWIPKQNLTHLLGAETYSRLLSVADTKQTELAK